MANVSTHSREGEMQIDSNPTIPCKILHIDHFDSLEETGDGHRHIFIVVDAYIRFTWLFPVKLTGTKEVIKYLETIFHIFGTSKMVKQLRGSRNCIHFKRIRYFFE